MPKRKTLLQKISLVAAAISFTLALISALMLYLRLDNLGSDNPISASLMASVFFFISVGVVLIVIGKTDLPSFKLEKPEQK